MIVAILGVYGIGIFLGCFTVVLFACFDYSTTKHMQSVMERTEGRSYEAAIAEKRAHVVASIFGTLLWPLLAVAGAIWVLLRVPAAVRWFCAGARDMWWLYGAPREPAEQSPLPQATAKERP